MDCSYVFPPELVNFLEEKVRCTAIIQHWKTTSKLFICGILTCRSDHMDLDWLGHVLVRVGVSGLTRCW